MIKSTHLFVAPDGWKMWFWWIHGTIPFQEHDHVYRLDARQDGPAVAVPYWG